MKLFNTVPKIDVAETLEKLISELLVLAKETCWNTISKNFVFILSDISEEEGENYFIKRLNRNKLNKKKIPKSFIEAVTDLKDIYDSIYDINLHVYKSEKNRTIIDIQYYLKSRLDADFLKTVIDNPPMLHCKIAIPPYVKKDSRKKFDINWELEGLRYKWHMLWWKREIKRS
ncbi:hypothetical protein ACFSJW_06240 [Flavobacterium artemisiae]|uniref:Uncharacterized protein n=1 Tax=Flavobacterium artemisiae TaxID=2126556 RepID=A0ABW4HCD9_9FLAO